MGRFDDLMVMTTVSTLPTKWDHVKQTLGVAMIAYQNPDKQIIAGEEMAKVYDLAQRILRHRPTGGDGTQDCGYELLEEIANQAEQRYQMILSRI
jgi:hypothetical protein